MRKDTPTPLGMKVEFAILLAVGGGGAIVALWFAAVSAYDGFGLNGQRATAIAQVGALRAYAALRSWAIF